MNFLNESEALRKVNSGTCMWPERNYFYAV